jgi:hypothetical protein
MRMPYRIKRAVWLTRQWMMAQAARVHQLPLFQASDQVEHVCLYPAFRTQAELVDALQKIRYYVDPAQVEAVDICLECDIDFDITDDAQWPVPDYNLALLPDMIVSVRVDAAPRSLWRSLAKYDRVLVWDWTFEERPGRVAQRSKKLLNVDRHRCGGEAWSWSEFAYQTRPQRNAEAQARSSVQRFNAHIDSLPRYSKAYVFGTGPSLDQAMDKDFSDGYRIVCNTIVENDALMRHLDPHIIVAGDAVYHYALNVHASAFRRDLSRALQQNETMLFITRDLYEPLIARHYPDVAQRAVTAESGVAGIHLDARSRLVYHQWPMGNILNALMLPLASTLSDDVYFLGFDGRAPDDTYFWKTAAQSSYEALKPPMREAHPAFFTTPDYEAYAQGHSDNADAIMKAGEAMGKRYTCLNKTYIPAFQKRAAQDCDATTVSVDTLVT